MPRESLKSKRERAKVVAERLKERYPGFETELKIDDDPFHLVIAVLLSAQTTDRAVNKVTPVLWSKYPTIESLANADVKVVEEIIRTIGFYHTKAANVIKCAQMILSDFGGKVPDNMEDLQKLPGVGRKTANIVMNVAFNKPEGIAVDTHVFRITHKLKFSNADTPSKTEQDLLKIFPAETWSDINHEMVLFGRDTCIARRPKCAECILADVCPSSGVKFETYEESKENDPKAGHHSGVSRRKPKATSGKN